MKHIAFVKVTLTCMVFSRVRKPTSGNVAVANSFDLEDTAALGDRIAELRTRENGKKTDVAIFTTHITV